MKYHEILNQGSKILKLNKIKSHSLDSEILLSSLLNVDRSQLIINHNKIVKNNEKKNFFFLINRRKKNEPISYITGYKEFWNNNFKVDKNVLIPRPDTETIVEQVLSYLRPQSTKKILDIGTGSGCIIISILKERKKCKGVGIDISKNAIKLAKYNAKIQHIKNRINFFHSDIDNFLTDKYDLIISNPPYIKQHEINGLEKDIKNYEPRVALNGGIDGYSKIRLTIKKSSALIKKNGKLFLEIGSNQVMETLKILKFNGFFVNKIVKDLANKNRCVVSTKI
tara:strand:+ start:208 stop:1050 length:843 start_codon:yes stop_codon:yes gene_type:complete